MSEAFGTKLREDIAADGIVPLIGVYDVFSATIAARHFNGIFISGFSFAASHYGLPDIGFIAWSDIVAFTQRVRAVLPRHHLVVDIDDGYCDPEVACHVVSLLEAAGASGVVLEDQMRPRRCGHADGKQLLELEDFTEKLQRVLETRTDLYVVARTDATDRQEILRRVDAFSAMAVDAVLVDGIRELALLDELRSRTPKTVVFNQISGGNSPPCTLSRLRAVGVGLVNYSTPCLFAAQGAIDEAMRALWAGDGRLAGSEDGAGQLADCSALLKENLVGRYQ